MHCFRKTLASFDQFSNLVLHDAVERRICYYPSENTLYFTDVPLGLYVVRGDSMVLSGPLLTHPSQHQKEVSLEEYESLCKSELAQPPLKWDFDEDLTA
jgi:U6 snRNA-associated Sm-like protein LSm1